MKNIKSTTKTSRPAGASKYKRAVSDKAYADFTSRLREALTRCGEEDAVEEALECLDLYLRCRMVGWDELRPMVKMALTLLLPEVDRAMMRSERARRRNRKELYDVVMPREAQPDQVIGPAHEAEAEGALDPAEKFVAEAHVQPEGEVAEPSQLSAASTDSQDETAADMAGMADWSIRRENFFDYPVLNRRQRRQAEQQRRREARKPNRRR